MGKVIYSLNVSLDGFVETPDHDLGWATIDDELHSWFNDRTREAAVFVYGRRMYELMAASWPSIASYPDVTDTELEFGRIWTAKPKVVFSSTLDHVEWNSRLVRGDVGDEVARLREELDGTLDVGGPTLAAELIRRGLVDEYGLVVHPVVLGAGTPFFPSLDTPIHLRPTESMTFASGVRYLGYAAT
jgi:dihydrofolate reductase